MKNENADKRAKAVRALGLLEGNVEAEKAAVRRASRYETERAYGRAAALGSMQAQHANVELEGALLDSEPGLYSRRRIRCFCCTTTWL